MIGKLNHDRGFAAIGLVQPKTPINVGHVLRAAHCFGAASVAYTGQRYSKAPTPVRTVLDNRFVTVGIMPVVGYDLIRSGLAEETLAGPGPVSLLTPEDDGTFDVTAMTEIDFR